MFQSRCGEVTAELAGAAQIGAGGEHGFPFEINLVVPGIAGCDVTAQTGVEKLRLQLQVAEFESIAIRVQIPAQSLQAPG